VSVRFIAAWYDCWIGFYWDRAGRRLYILPVPCLGLCVEFGPAGRPEGSQGKAPVR
jgi:hypothetical protein